MNASDYRKALGCFATGVTIVTTRWQGNDWGMTCNSFASVSLEPPLVLWSLRKAASSVDAFTQADGFQVSVLSAQQEPLARQFAQGDMASRFAGVGMGRLSSGRLHLADALAWFDCERQQVVDAGDHHILIGAVKQFQWQEGQALSFWRSRFSTLAVPA